MVIENNIKNMMYMAFMTCLIFSASIYADPSGKVPGKYIVKFNDVTKAQAAGKALSSGERLKKISSSIFKKGLKNTSEIDKYFLFLTEDSLITDAEVIQILGPGNVEYVEPDCYLEFFDYPGDEFFPYQWYLYNDGQEYPGIDRYDGNNNDTLVFKSGTPGVDIGMTDYYTNPPAENTRVVVAIIDSGVDLEHPELKDKIWKNLDEIPGNNIDDDNNGYVDDTIGYDISGDIVSISDPVGDNDPSDLGGHGTHLAGLVAASGDEVGIVGVTPSALIMPVKIRPVGTSSVAAEAIFYAVNAGAKVINISWGTLFESGILNEALNFARVNGVFVAIAAGNTGSTDRFFPAAFDSSFTVAAGNADGFLAYFSTYGAHIDLVAPGHDILSLRAQGTDLYYATEPGLRIIGDDSLHILADGTSMSAPIVAGAAALMWSVHPNLTLYQVEQALLDGAVDILDPLEQGDDLPGYDTLSGYGYLNLGNSMSLLQEEAIYIISPELKQRYTSDVPVEVNRKGGYGGYWRLEYSLNSTDNWQLAAEGSELPADLILYRFDQTDNDGIVYLKLVDKFNREQITSFYYVRNNLTQLTSPIDGEHRKYDIPIYGSVYGPDYDSLTLYYSKDLSKSRLFMSTGEYFDSLLFNWTVSGTDTGQYYIYLNGYYSNQVVVESCLVIIESAFSVGWPKNLGSRGALSPVVTDYNDDGNKELVISSANGLHVFYADGAIVEGFPVNTDHDMRSIPAIYDVDRDGEDEIIITNEDGIFVYNYDGSLVDGWPQYCYTGLIPYGFGYPNPTVTELGYGEDSAIVIINKMGQIMAYEFNGDSYFYSLQGLFATLDPRISDYFSFGGGTSPFVTSYDANGDNLFEVLASYSSPKPYTGIGLFDGRTGLAAFDREDPIILRSPSVHGTTLADLNNDGLYEVITLANDTNHIPGLWVQTNTDEDFPGWPILLPEIYRWLGSYPVAADLDLDEIPEILFTFFEYDVAYLYIFKADGTPYFQLAGAPYGVAFSDFVTFGIPAVANLTGDDYPEIILRTGHIFPGTGPEMVYILDNQLNHIPGWPISTPARDYEVLSTRFAPLVDDLDSDGLVELIMVSDNRDILVWDFDASYDEGKNKSKYLGDNLNSNRFNPGSISTDVNDEITLLPLSYGLKNYPNPFNPVSTISFDLPVRSHTSLEVFNILGQKVETLVDGELPAGHHLVKFDGAGFASGVYLYRLKTDEISLTKKMVLMK